MQYATKNKVQKNVYATRGGEYNQITNDLTPSAYPFLSLAFLPVLLQLSSTLTPIPFLIIFSKVESLNILYLFGGFLSCTDELFLWN